MTVILAFILLTVIFMAMSVGILLGRKPITGSCGGVGAALGEKDYSCEICGGDTRKCEQQQDSNIKAASGADDAAKLFYRAK